MLEFTLFEVRRLASMSRTVVCPVVSALRVPPMPVHGGVPMRAMVASLAMGAARMRRQVEFLKRTLLKMLEFTLFEVRRLASMSRTVVCPVVSALRVPPMPVHGGVPMRAMVASL
eukprot:Hpha_TRINITY_DN15349_c2_g3::TRINITY_DN15349_c2_g3_i6::g.90307::m.90307